MSQAPAKKPRPQRSAATTLVNRPVEEVEPAASGCHVSSRINNAATNLPMPPKPTTSSSKGTAAPKKVSSVPRATVAPIRPTPPVIETTTSPRVLQTVINPIGPTEMAVERLRRNRAAIHQQSVDDDSSSEEEADTSNFLPPDARTELLPQHLVQPTLPEPPNSDVDEDTEPIENQTGRAASAPPSPERRMTTGSTRPRPLESTPPPRKIVVREATISPIRAAPVAPSRIKRSKGYHLLPDIPAGSSPPPEIDEEAVEEVDSDADKPGADPRDLGKEILNPVPSARPDNINWFKKKYRPLLQDARDQYEQSLSHKTYFPSEMGQQRLVMVGYAWSQACSTYLRDTGFRNWKVGSTACGRYKTAATSHVVGRYNLAPSSSLTVQGLTREQIIQRTAEGFLVDDAFECDPQWVNGKGVICTNVRFTNPAIVDVIYEAVFKVADEEELKSLDAVYDPMVALACTAIQCTLQEYCATGIRTKIQMSECLYKSHYERYIKQMADMQANKRSVQLNNIFTAIHASCVRRRAPPSPIARAEAKTTVVPAEDLSSDEEPLVL